MTKQHAEAYSKLSLHEKCPKYGVFFWSIFSRIQTEHRDLLRKSLYLVRVRETKDQKKLLIWTLFLQCLSNIKDEVFFYKS